MKTTPILVQYLGSQQMWKESIAQLLDEHWPQGEWMLLGNEDTDEVEVRIYGLESGAILADSFVNDSGKQLKVLIVEEEEAAAKYAQLGIEHVELSLDKRSWRWQNLWTRVKRSVASQSESLSLFNFPARVVDEFFGRSELTFCLLDEEGTIQYFNNRLKEKLGFDREDLVGKSFKVLMEEDLHGLAMESYKADLSEGRTTPSIWPVTTKSGEHQKVLSFPHIFSDATGYKYNLSVALDVEELYQDHIKQDPTTDILREIASTSPVIMTIYDLGRKLNIYQSRSMFEMLGYGEEYLEKAKQNPEGARRRMFHEDYIREIDKYYEEVQSLGPLEKKQLIYRVRDVDDAWRWIRKITSVFKREEDNHVSQVLNTFEDITVQKESESKIFITESRNRALISAVPDFIFRIDAEGYYLDYKGAVEEGLSVVKDGQRILPNSLIGRNITEVLPENISEEFMEKLELAIQSAEVQTISYMLKVKNGDRYFETLINKSGPDEVICVARDVTDRKNQEDVLRNRLQFIKFTSKLSNDILLSEVDQVDEIIDSALDFVCKTTGANRAFIYTSTEKNEAYSLANSWVDGHTPDYQEKDRVVSRLDFQMLENLLRSEHRFYRNFTVDGNADLPPGIQNIVNDQDIHCTCLTPLMVKDRFYGFLGFDLVDTSLEWKEEQLDYFDIISRLLSNTIYRRYVVEELIESREKALRASRAKEDFLATMSHEIRTPLNAIIGMNDLLRNSELSEEQMDMLEVSKVSADHLLQLINDILDFTKIESGRLELDEVEFTLEDLVRSVEKAYRAEAEAKGLYFEAKIRDHMPFSVLGDEVRIHQVLSNLVSNAIKFTSKGGIKIVLDKLSEDDKVIALKFSVTDTGIGIAQKKIPEIFDRFIQEDSSTSRKYGGTGLGLSIVRRLSDLMEGDIKVMSEKDKGSTFVFRIALRKIATKGPSPGMTWSNIQSYHGKRVLVVEDNILNQKVATGFLMRHDLEVDIANNGLEALKCFETANYDMILMDLQMPEMDGLEASSKIRGLKGGEVPIVALTANANPQMKEDVKEVGIHEYLTKPFRAIDLQKILHKYLK